MACNYSKYFKRLYERRIEAVKVQFREVRFKGWQPVPNKCHDNVDHWVNCHTQSKAVRGWIFWPPDETGRCTFMAHSVVEENGELIDITPIDENTPRKGLFFLTHLGSEAEFALMKTACSQVPYPPVTMVELRE